MRSSSTSPTTARRWLLGAAAATAFGLLWAAPALALTDTWTCNNSFSGQKCYSGAGYHSWFYVGIGVSSVSGEVCAKAVTQSGNLRSGSGCNYNTDSRVSVFSGGTPISVGYGYWGGSGPPRTVAGNAGT
jgi:hypothetical protein